MDPIVINGAFRGQVVTGQQRYATEVASRLAGWGVQEVPLPVALRGHPVGAWAWAQHFALRRSGYLSLTSRAPINHARGPLVVHDTFVIDHPEWFSARYARSHSPVLARQIATAESIIAVSPTTAERVRRLRPDVPIIVAPNAPSEVFSRVATSPSGPIDRLVTSVLGTDRCSGYFLAVGSLDRRKNLARLCRAYLMLSDSVRAAYPLVLVGGEAALFGRVELSDGLGIIRTGYVPDEALAALYARATCVVFPSLAEGFGLPAVEAQAAGARLAVSDLEVFRWVCGQYASYFDPTSTESIYENLKGQLDAPVVSDSPTELITQRFNWDVSSEEIYRFINR